MGTRSRGEGWEGRHSKQKEIIILFFSLSVLQLKTTLKRSVSTELFTLPNKRAFLSSFPLALPPVWMYGWRKMIAGIVWQQQPQSLFWKQVGSGSWARTERKRERRKKKRQLPGQINNSVLEDASPVFLLLYNSLSQDPAISYLLKQESHTGKTLPCYVSYLVIGTGRGDMLTKVCSNMHLKCDVLLVLQ